MKLWRTQKMCHLFWATLYVCLATFCVAFSRDMPSICSEIGFEQCVISRVMNHGRIVYWVTCSYVTLLP